MVKLIYVGCALSHSSKKYRTFIKKIKKEVHKKLKDKVVILEFLGLTSGSDVDVYDTDIGNVKKCHAFIGFVDKPATGLGYEIGTAIEARKYVPFLILHDVRTNPSRLVTGAVKRHQDRGQLKSYTHTSDAVSSIVHFLETCVL